MPDLVEWYLTELTLRLEKQLPADQIDLIVSEAESHLRHATFEIMQSEISDPDAAAREAVRRFGSPENVANEHLVTNGLKVCGVKPIFLSVVSGGIASLCFMLSFIWLSGYFDNFGETWQNGLAIACTVICSLAVVVAAWKGRRSFRLELTAMSIALALGLIPYLSFSMITVTNHWQGVSRWRLTHDSAKLSQTLYQLDLSAKFIRSTAQRITAQSHPPQGISWLSVPALTDPISVDTPPPAPAARYSIRLLREWNDSLDLPLDLDGFQPNGTPILTLFGRPRQLSTQWGADSFLAATSQTSVCFLAPVNSPVAMVDGRTWIFRGVSSQSTAVDSWLKADKSLATIQTQRENLADLQAATLAAKKGQLFFWNPRMLKESIPWVLLFWPILIALDTLGCAFRRLERVSKRVFA